MPLFRRATSASEYTDLLRRSVGGAVFPVDRELSAVPPPPGRGLLAEALRELALADAQRYAETIWSGPLGDWAISTASLSHIAENTSRLNTQAYYYHCTYTFSAGVSANPTTIGIYSSDATGFYVTLTGTSGVYHGVSGTTSFVHSAANVYKISLVKGQLTFTVNGTPVRSTETVATSLSYYASVIGSSGSGQSLRNYEFSLVKVRWWTLLGGFPDVQNWSLSKTSASHIRDTETPGRAYWADGQPIASSFRFTISNHNGGTTTPFVVAIVADPANPTPEGGGIAFLVFGNGVFLIDGSGPSISYTKGDEFELIFNREGDGVTYIYQNANEIGSSSGLVGATTTFAFLQSVAANDSITGVLFEEYAPAYWSVTTGAKTDWVSLADPSPLVKATATPSTITSISAFSNSAVFYFTMSDVVGSQAQISIVTDSTAVGFGSPTNVVTQSTISFYNGWTSNTPYSVQAGNSYRIRLLGIQGLPYADVAKLQSGTNYVVLDGAPLRATVGGIPSLTIQPFNGQVARARVTLAGTGTTITNISFDDYGTGSAVANWVPGAVSVSYIQGIDSGANTLTVTSSNYDAGLYSTTPQFGSALDLVYKTGRAEVRHERTNFPARLSTVTFSGTDLYVYDGILASNVRVASNLASNDQYRIRTTISDTFNSSNAGMVLQKLNAGVPTTVYSLPTFIDGIPAYGAHRPIVMTASGDSFSAADLSYSATLPFPTEWQVRPGYSWSLLPTAVYHSLSTGPEYITSISGFTKDLSASFTVAAGATNSGSWFIGMGPGLPFNPLGVYEMPGFEASNGSIYLLRAGSTLSGAGVPLTSNTVFSLSLVDGTDNLTLAVNNGTTSNELTVSMVGIAYLHATGADPFYLQSVSISGGTGASSGWVKETTADSWNIATTAAQFWASATLSSTIFTNNYAFPYLSVSTSPLGTNLSEYVGIGFRESAGRVHYASLSFSGTEYYVTMMSGTTALESLALPGQPESVRILVDPCYGVHTEIATSGVKTFPTPFEVAQVARVGLIQTNTPAALFTNMSISESSYAWLTAAAPGFYFTMDKITPTELRAGPSIDYLDTYQGATLSSSITPFTSFLPIGVSEGSIVGLGELTGPPPHRFEFQGSVGETSVITIFVANNSNVTTFTASLTDEFALQVSGGLILPRVKRANGTVRYLPTSYFADTTGITTWKTIVKLAAGASVSGIRFSSDASMIPFSVWNAIENTTSLNHWVTTPTSISYLTTYTDPDPLLTSVASYPVDSAYLSISAFSLSNSGRITAGLVQTTDENWSNTSYFNFQIQSNVANVEFNVCGTVYDTSFKAVSLAAYEVQISSNIVQARITKSNGDVQWETSVDVTGTVGGDPFYALVGTAGPPYAVIPQISFTGLPLIPPVVEPWISVSGALAAWSPRTATSLVYTGASAEALVITDASYQAPNTKIDYGSFTAANGRFFVGLTTSSNATYDSNAASAWFQVANGTKGAFLSISFDVSGFGVGNDTSAPVGLDDVDFANAVLRIQISDNILAARATSKRGPWWQYVSDSNAAYAVRMREFANAYTNATGLNLSFTFANGGSLSLTEVSPRWAVAATAPTSTFLTTDLQDWTFSGSNISYGGATPLNGSPYAVIESVSRYTTPYFRSRITLSDTAAYTTVRFSSDRDGAVDQDGVGATFESIDSNNIRLTWWAGQTVDVTISQTFYTEFQLDSNSNATIYVSSIGWPGTAVYSNTVSYTGYSTSSNVITRISASGGVTHAGFGFSSNGSTLPVVFPTGWSAVPGTTTIDKWTTTPTSLSYNATYAESSPAVYSTLSYATPYVTASLAWVSGNGPARVGLVTDPASPNSFGYWFNVIESGPGTVFFSVCGTSINTGLFGAGPTSYQVQSDGTNVQARVDAGAEFWVYTVSQSGAGKMYGYVRTDKVGSGTYAYVPSISVNNTPVLPQYGLDSNGWGASDYWTITSNSLSTTTIGHLRSVGTDTLTSTVSYDYAVFSIAPETGQTFITFNDTTAMGLAANRTSSPDVQLYYKGAPDNQIWYDYVGGPPGGAAIGPGSESAVSLTLSVDSASCNATITVVTSPNGVTFTSNSTTVSLTAPKYHGWIQSGSSNTIGRFSLARVGPNISYGWGDVGDPATWSIVPAGGPPGLFDIGHLSTTPETIITISSYLPSRLQVTPTSATTALTSLSYGLATTRTPGASDYWLWFSNTTGDNFDVFLYNGSTSNSMSVATGISNINIADTMLRVSSNVGTGNYELIADVGINSGPGPSSITITSVAAVPYYAFITSAFSNGSLPVATNVRFSNV